MEYLEVAWGGTAWVGMEDSGPAGDELTQFQGGKMKREEEAEKRWMKDFWNLIETVQKVWGGRGLDGIFVFY